MPTKRCSRCRVPKPLTEFHANQKYCKLCAAEYNKLWQRCNPDKMARYYRKRNVDSSFDVIAPRFLKPPRNRGGRGKTVCDRCPSHSRCKVYVKLDLAVDCEKLSKSDIIHMNRVGVDRLQEIGFLDRVQVWDSEIWERYYDALEEAL